MVNILIIAIIVAILGGAACYIHKAKKNGAKCIGCPHAKTCGSCSCNCGH